MRPIQIIRVRLGVSQREIAEAIGCDQTNVSRYERGQTVHPSDAARLIEFAKSRGLELTYDHVYGAAEIPHLGAEVRS